MESGQNNEIQPLLTIAIPTWNRAKQLGEALEHLLPQIEKYPDKIEFIISDNASTDETIAIINNTLINYSIKKFKLFQQEVNTGFFGNFRKCISLGTGKYFWLLSDDDFVFDGVIDELMIILTKEDVGAVFLNDWTSDISKKECFSCRYINKLEFFSDRPFRHSLISSIIYRHNVTGNDAVFETLKGNALIGYAVYLKAVYGYNKFAILSGNSLLARNDHEVRFNALWIFTVDLAECLELAKEFYSKEIISKITNSFLKTNTRTHYKSYKFFGRFNFSENRTLKLFTKYVTYLNFWLKIFPIIICPKSIYKVYYHARKILQFEE